MNNIQTLAMSAHVLCLEEVHGQNQGIVSCFAVWLPGWTVFASSALRGDGSQSFGAGGVAIALCPAMAAGAMSLIDHNIHVDGFCNSVTINFPALQICSILFALLVCKTTTFPPPRLGALVPSLLGDHLLIV